MTKRMLIDGTHPEETRVVVMSGSRLDEHDVETSRKKQIKGNIYLAKVTRVEPSLQAAFVDYGGNRHGFLAFDEIHPDYYQIPVEDREALLAEQREMEVSGRAAQQHIDEMDGSITDRFDPAPHDDPEPPEALNDDAGTVEPGNGAHADAGPDAQAPESEGQSGFAAHAGAPDSSETQPSADLGVPETAIESASEAPHEASGSAEETAEHAAAEDPSTSGPHDAVQEEAPPAMAERADLVSTAAEPTRPHHESRGEERQQRQRRPGQFHRRYKIQEVIKRRQILLVQVVKEERGNKGAALTTYISLAGRYCVLMPNSTRSGGISRKVTSPVERRKLRKILDDLEMPDGMGVIVRTAGMERSKAEIKRDFDFLVRTWDEIREQTLRSSAPALVYEEANIIKRAIRDLYNKDMDEVLVEGDEAYQAAKNMMRLLMPSHAKRVKAFKDEDAPLFHRYQVEGQLDAMHQPEVHLKSGGYVVIHATEALVAIDVNSGKSTRERNIEETALKTNIEAADEVARQLRLRDLAGLVVIDFIDMEETRNMRAVERRVKEAMKNDRARIQIGRISAFGLLELSRQRLRPSLLEASTEVCLHCHGTGHVRSTESMAVRVLRSIEDEGIRRRTAELVVNAPPAVALYILNQKRHDLVAIEQRYSFRVEVRAEATMTPSAMRLDRIRARDTNAPLPVAELAAERVSEIEEESEAAAPSEAASSEREAPAEGERRRGRRRRGRRRGGDDFGHRRAGDMAARGGEEPSARRGGDVAAQHDVEDAPAHVATDEVLTSEPAADQPGEGGSEQRLGHGEEDGERRRRRRGRRGGRRRRRGGDDARGADGGQPSYREPQRAPEAEPRPHRMETPADWTPYPPIADDEPPAHEGPQPTSRDEPAHAGNGGGTEERDLSADIGAPATQPPEPPPEERPVEAPSASASGPKRRGWWQRIVE